MENNTVLPMCWFKCQEKEKFIKKIDTTAKWYNSYNLKRNLLSRLQTYGANSDLRVPCGWYLLFDNITTVPEKQLFGKDKLVEVCDVGLCIEFAVVLTEEAIHDKVDCWLYGTKSECNSCSKRRKK